MIMERELFALLRLGLGNTVAEEEDLSSFLMLTSDQWVRVGELAQEQGVLGVLVDGFDRLDASCADLTKNVPEQLKYEWIGNVLLGFEVDNHKQFLVIDDIQQKWAAAGIRTMVMKGQAMGVYYPVPQHRSPGDIDCYLFGGYESGNKIAKVFADNVNEDWYKHSVISYKGETIENHQYFVHTREGRRSKQLNQLLTDLLRDESIEFRVLPGTGALLPPPMFNAVFLTYHAFVHFLEEGVRLKLILDWAMFLKRDADKVEWKEFWKICDKYSFRRFAEVMNDIACHYLGVKLQNGEIAVNSPYTEKVLQSSFNDKDYVFGSGKSAWNNRWHIVRNLFKYRWKYNEIYQRSIVWQMWWYAVGFLFKTD